MAVAYVGRCLRVPVTIVVPETTSKEAISRIKDEEAKVLVHGKVTHSLLVNMLLRIRCIAISYIACLVF